MKAKNAKRMLTINKERIRSLNNAVLAAVRDESLSVITTQTLRKPTQNHYYPHESGITFIEHYQAMLS